ncbi:heterokaryon incompatibility protein-domain-containing protein [Fusarium solani]|uniref:Heterokaryon incompatibility protein-domain-containing protein n=1 Tax=Fusarium solani TaxID=169388 RepID=A0A9P9GF00_FUSSL|nr:heterokaryon incompatibility protein-domain-containing protein [Fusarium solani]KAH7237302.1 heterokaryon incompatibility protein-domain-containing protein [Fusarium solani]
MRLLHTTEHKVKEVKTTAQFAILSHTWEKDEITFQDIERPGADEKEGYNKLRNACSVAAADGFDYIWIDTCCIDKTSSAELSEAINSMYRWYQEAEVCYAYLADVPFCEFSQSRWFTRGWTLQELIAPSTVIFFDKEWEVIGTKSELARLISDRTQIPIGILSGGDIWSASVAQRMSWASKRKTTRIEDLAYCLMGIFDIHMPMIYGEGERAFIRLQEQIMKTSDDFSLFAWRSTENHGGLLATSPAAFDTSHSILTSSGNISTEHTLYESTATGASRSSNKKQTLNNIATKPYLAKLSMLLTIGFA